MKTPHNPKKLDTGLKKQIEVIPTYYKYILNQKASLGKIYPINLLVGGRNSGKSHFMEQIGAMNLSNKSDYKLLVVEDVETNIGEGVKDGIESRIDDFGYSSFFKSIKQPAQILNTVNNNSVIFKGYHSTKQQKQVKSLNEVTAIWYEEAENITYEQFKALRMQLRGGEPDDRQLFLSLNPINERGFISQYFFKGEPTKVFEYFDDGRPKVFEKTITMDIYDPATDKSSQVSIPCMIVVTTHWDNPYLTPEQRADIEDLKNTNQDLYEMLSEGKFVRPGGAFYPEFRRNVHVTHPFTLEPWYDRYIAMDYGLDMFSVGFFAVDDNGNHYLYNEINRQDLIISEAAKLLREYIQVQPGEIKRIYAPPDLWNRRNDTGRSAEDIFRENGIHLHKSSNNVDNGCMAVKEAIKVIETRDTQTGETLQTSKLKIFRTCEVTINNLIDILTDEKNPNRYAKDPHDVTHSNDMLRYYSVMRFNKSIKQTKEEYDPYYPTQSQYDRGRYSVRYSELPHSDIINKLK